MHDQQLQQLLGYYADDDDNDYDTHSILHACMNSDLKLRAMTVVITITGLLHACSHSRLANNDDKDYHDYKQTTITSQYPYALDELSYQSSRSSSLHQYMLANACEADAD